MYAYSSQQVTLHPPEHATTKADAQHFMIWILGIRTTSDRKPPTTPQRLFLVVAVRAAATPHDAIWILFWDSRQIKLKTKL
jgi:hypothetical protein